MHTVDLFSETKPSAARRFLFRDSYALESPSQAIKWWEKRRLAYNVAVGATGLVSLTAMAIATGITSGELLAGPPLLAVVVYAVIANCFFTCGWVAELMLRPVFGRRTGTVGATFFRYGLAFSIGITLIPVGLSVLQLLAHLGSKLF